MAAPKGHRIPNAPRGRPKGAKNKATARREALIAKGGDTPLDYLLGVMRDTKEDKALRLDAAKAAAPYVHPKLQTLTHKGDPENPIALTVEARVKAVREMIEGVFGAGESTEV